MKLLNFLVEIFIDTFGITRPNPRNQRIVGLVLGGFLLATAIGAVMVMGFLWWRTHAR
jgi:hypothetical protein